LIKHSKFLFVLSAYFKRYLFTIINTEAKVLWTAYDKNVVHKPVNKKLWRDGKVTIEVGWTADRSEKTNLGNEGKRNFLKDILTATLLVLKYKQNIFFIWCDIYRVEK
jgi:hypothetical protein